jgi:protein-S-isoprenylcysteine O-methyltransferase Ste14
VFLGVVFAASSLTMFGIFPSRPELLEERYKPPLQAGQPLADKVLTPLLAISFLALILFIPIDVFRLRWLGGPGLVIAWVGLVLFAAGWSVIAIAMPDNPLAAPVVKAQHERGQSVVRTGLDRVVRHPMYAGAIVLMLGAPLWLGSWAGVLLAAVPLATLVLRVAVEERWLRRELWGYEDHARRVRWRLLPLIW